MSVHAICLRRDETGRLARVLAAAGLPAEDLDKQGKTFFRLVDEVGLIGFGGWEGRGSNRLLRSLVVVPERRRRGLGGVALAEIERRAREAGTARLHLLTTTAAPFFRSHGYSESERGQAPSTIRASKEFSSLCPASATYMIKTLQEG